VPGHVLHGDPELAVDRSAVVDGDDVAVDQARRQVGLSLESRAEIRVRGEGGIQQLERVTARQPRMLRQIDRTHPAGAEGGFDGVPSELVTWGQCHRRTPI